MSMSIGGIYKLNEIGLAAWEKEAKNIGINPKTALSRIRIMADSLEPCLRAAAKDLLAAGITGADKMAERILQHGGIRNWQNN
jgi:hypothetical protein